MTNDIDGAVLHLAQLLDTERKLIRSGQLGMLADIVAQKEYLVAILSLAGAEKLAMLSNHLHENQQLLAAAIKGLRAARQRVEMIHRASHSLDSYDSQGRARSIGPACSSIERRA
ncbi:hypothetical protein CCR83_08950 [Rhodobacter veldkampii DSM 11550]|uniref:Flagellar biosynthesis protein FlgN n=1 Tax=Phaeovulum veldkampii DSM 11550 TaxID=1185920 RepID=A0A2T4JLH9_9RHOB|nr:hypothetical protein [Phaeovulum veldkampii]MBK5946553.1 hypothetical protein [Phaeovulum veldkampii DSM 11550]PTE18755.1 hypothetical protein C5F46_02430 [Phaeovulum veldkampii DSM 11550]TDQ60032.1 hypothetical protein EV658_107131 [Phaeovulum veldkampii DSM 11550]